MTLLMTAKSGCFAVMGNPVNHSLSPIIHYQFAKQVGLEIYYEKMLVDSARFKQQVYDFFNQGGRGLNITAPCKLAAFNLCEKTTSRALKAQAVNTLSIKAGLLYGDNTDGIGLLRDLKRYIDLKNKTVLLLGTGGGAAGILAPLLATKPAGITLAYRTLAHAKALQHRFSGVQLVNISALEGRYDVILNATSAGLDNQSPVLTPAIWAANPFCYDLAYQKNGETPFVAAAKSSGCNAVDGMGMLVEQAAESFFGWHGVRPDTQAVLRDMKRTPNT